MKGTPKKLMDWLYEQDKEKVFVVKPYREKRSLNQNDYYWKLLNELALTMKLDKEKLHFDMLKHYSSRYEILVPSDSKIRGIEYYEKKSIIKKGEKEYAVYHVYSPSHELNTEEFSLLLEGIIQECKNVGIDTRTYEEIRKDEMYERYI